MTGTWSRRDVVTRIAVPALVSVALGAAPLFLASRLPDPWAVHWGFDGHPNGHVPWWAFEAFFLLLWGAAWATLLRTPSPAPQWAAANIYGLGGVLLLGHAIARWANLDEPSWRAARHLPGHGSAVPVSAGRWPDPTPSGGRASVGLVAGEQAAWMGRGHNRRLPVAVALGIGLAASTRDPRVEVLGAPLVLAGLVLSQVTVVVGPTAGPGGASPSKRWRTARAITVSARRPGRHAVIVRSGDALELERTSGSKVVVTVDDGERRRAWSTTTWLGDPR